LIKAVRIYKTNTDLVKRYENLYQKYTVYFTDISQVVHEIRGAGTSLGWIKHVGRDFGELKENKAFVAERKRIHEKAFEFTEKIQKIYDKGKEVSIDNDRVNSLLKNGVIGQEITETILRKKIKVLAAEMHDIKNRQQDIYKDIKGVYSEIEDDFNELMIEYFVGKNDAHVERVTDAMQLIGSIIFRKRVAGNGNVDVQKVLKSIVHEKRSLILEKAARVVYANMPVVKGERTLVYQLLSNLIENAIKYNEQEIKYVKISYKKENGFHVFSVKDDGIGIPKVYYDKVFESFGRVPVIASKYPGTGIGLNVCKERIEEAGGNIWFESEPDKGSTFYFSIPIKEQK
jgi:signal transduction histidine kinase